MKLQVTLLFAFALISCLLLAPGWQLHSAVAEESAQQAQDLSDQIMSPFCPGRTLSACPSESARKLRDQVGGWFDEGFSEPEVREKLINIYGEDILGKPAFRGFGILSVLLPAIFVLLGSLLIISKLRTGKNKDSKRNIDESHASAIDEEIRKRLI